MEKDKVANYVFEEVQAVEAVEAMFVGGWRRMIQRLPTFDVVMTVREGHRERGWEEGRVEAVVVVIG
jgi:hypothetical protein